MKIDKKYFEDQVSELQKRNQEMISNIENIMSEPKRSGSTVNQPSAKGELKEPLSSI